MANLNDGLWAWQQPGNNNRIINFQKMDGDPAYDGDVRIEFYGCCAFRITSPRGLSIFIDPWRNSPAGGDGQFFRFDLPQVAADIGISTHAHFDHDALHLLQAGMLFDRPVGNFRFADVSITGIADKHVSDYSGCEHDFNEYLGDRGINPYPPNNPRGYDNTLVVIETAGLRILHWGDNRPNPPSHIWELLGRIDVVLLPVDGSRHVLTYDEADAIMARLGVNVCIPHHYFTRGLFRVGSTMKTADEWVSRHASHELLGAAAVTLNKALLAHHRGHVMYFADHLAFSLPAGMINPTPERPS